MSRHWIEAVIELVGGVTKSGKSDLAKLSPLPVAARTNIIWKFLERTYRLSLRYCCSLKTSLGIDLQLLISCSTR